MGWGRPGRVHVGVLPALEASDVRPDGAGTRACLPVLYAPVEIEGRALVDGGVVDNVPVDVLSRMGGGRPRGRAVEPVRAAVRREGGSG